MHAGLDVERSIVHASLRGEEATPRRLIQLGGCPRLDPQIELLRKTRGISGRREGVPGHDARSLMLAMTVRRRTAEHRDDHVRPEGAYNPDDVCQELFTGPE